MNNINKKSNNINISQNISQNFVNQKNLQPIILLITETLLENSIQKFLMEKKPYNIILNQSDKNISNLSHNLKDILDFIIQSDFKSFLQKVFNTLHPVDKFSNNWHIDLMCSYLKRIEDGKITRLLVNIPPRSLKSICFSVAWPAWLLGHNPGLKIIVASYSDHISYKHSNDCRYIMMSDWYKRLFPKTIIKLGENRINKFITSKMGFRFATSINGSLIGEGADVIIVDEPHTPLQVLSTKMRERINLWFKQTLLSRLNDKKNGIILVAMQRLHPDDLCGILLDQNNNFDNQENNNNLENNQWVHLKIPLVAENNEEWNIDNFKYKRKIGESIDISRDKNIYKIKKEVGSYIFASQYQQDPSSISNKSFIRKQWIRYYDYDKPPPYSIIYQSWDCAIKTDNIHDFSVCTTWAQYNGYYYLLNVFKDRLEYPSLLKKIYEMAEKFHPCAILVEDKASGQQILQSIKSQLIFNTNNKNNKKDNYINSISKNYISQKNIENDFDKNNSIDNQIYNNDEYNLKLPIIPFNPKYDKKTRVMLITPLFEAGLIFLPKKAIWYDDLEYELCNFPNTKYDDQVDSISQFLLWKQNNNTSNNTKSIVNANNNDMEFWKAIEI